MKKKSMIEENIKLLEKDAESAKENGSPDYVPYLLGAIEALKWVNDNQDLYNLSDNLFLKYTNTREILNKISDKFISNK